MELQKPVTVINDRWRLDGIIGQGGFGTVYIATDLITNKIVAAKLQALPLNSSPSQIYDLEHESSFYSLFRDRPGIATLYDNGQSASIEFMVCELLGASLQSLFYHCERKFSLKTTLMLADQLIQRLEVFHSRNLLHRDVKPDNFAMGFGKENGKTVYILDFGLVSDFINDESCATAPSYTFCGSYYWASIAAHLDRSQSPKDDLESLAYMLIYFVRGSLPWQGAADDYVPTNAMSGRITKLKLSLPIDLICKDLPSEFGRHLKYVRSLKYNDKPNYAKLREMYQRLMKRLGHQYDGVYDWDIKEMNDNAQKDAKPAEEKNPASIHDKPPSKEIEQEQKDKQEPNKEPIAKAAPKRKIVLVKKADDESHPPKRQRRKPAEAEKKVAKPKKIAAKKAPAKKQVARKKAC